MAPDVTIGTPSVVSAETVDVLPDLKLPESISGANIKSSAMPNLEILEAELVLDRATRSYVLRRLNVAGRAGRILTTDLRSLTVPEIVSECIQLAPSGSDLEKMGRAEASFYEELKASNSPDLLLWVARRAAIAQAIAGAPNKEVMECFGVPQRTATRWIARAREAGLLD
jgi:hypothetical protein